MKTVFALALCLVFCMCTFGGSLPNPATGGKNGGKINLLFLRGNAEISFGRPIPLDEVYVEKILERGFHITVARDFNPLSLEYLKQFNVVIWINPSPYSAGSRYIGPATWQGGLHMLTVEKNAMVLKEYVNEGGGLLINPAIEEIGMPVSAAHREILKPYGLDTECAQVRDKKHQVEFDKKHNMYVSWTESFAKHPATEGVKRIYYPGYSMRWDDNVTTLPLYPRDKAWTSLVKAMPSATVSWYRGTPYGTGHWKDAAERETPSLAVARDFGKGRVAVISISHFHLFYYPYSDKGRHAECYFGAQKGQLMESGFDDVPSDLGRLLDNIYCWLAEPGAERGMGGYDEKTGIEIAAIPEVAVENLSEVWADKDPMNTGEVRPMKILVGVRSSYSDGKGSIRDYAEAGKKAGYDIIAFTETYEKMTDAEYRKFVVECRENSDEEIFLLPGIDIEDAIGNRFLILGKDVPVRAHLLAEDESATPGRKLIWNGHMLLGMGEVLPVAARPEHKAKLREKGALPPDLYSHCVGVAIETYRMKKTVDNGLFAYRWHLFNGSIPIPVAVHEVYSPKDVETAVGTGLQCYVNADTPAHAAFYFRLSHLTAGGNPMRFYVSSGPLVKSAEIDNWQSPHWKISLSAYGDDPISEILVQDQRGLYRKIMPNETEVDVFWHGDIGAQHWFSVELADAAGGRAFMSPMRTLPERHFLRCLDRQNWFGGLHFRYLTYTGRIRKIPKTGAVISLPGVTLPATPAPRLQLKYNGPGYTITDYLWDMTLVPGGRFPGADSSPIFNVQPNKFFRGCLRHIFYQRPGSRGSMPPMIQPIVDIELLKDLKTKGLVWPVVGKATDVKIDGDFIDLAVGDRIGNIIALTPLRVSAKGDIGFASPVAGVTVPAGKKYHAEYVLVESKFPDTVRKSMGFDGTPPFTISIKQGKLDGIGVIARFSSDKHGVAGKLKGVDDDPWWSEIKRLPVWLSGVNKRWPVGLWRSDTGAIQQYGVFEGIARGRLNVLKSTDFYFGNLLTSTDSNLNLAIASEWTETNLIIEVNNPTDHEIKAVIKSPKAIAGRKQVNLEVIAPPGWCGLLNAGEK